MAYAVAVVRNQFLLAKSIIIRKDWIFGLNECKTLNSGVNRNQNHVIFYSIDENSEADFTVDKKNMFDGDIEEAERANALYSARIYRFFGELFL